MWKVGGVPIFELIYIVVSIGRFLFYIPQVRAIVGCKNRASSSSLSASAYFAFSHWVAAAYFAFEKPDFWAAVMTTGNAVAMTAITLCVMWKRRNGIMRSFALWHINVIGKRQNKRFGSSFDGAELAS